MEGTRFNRRPWGPSQTAHEYKVNFVGRSVPCTARMRCRKREACGRVHLPLAWRWERMSDCAAEFTSILPGPGRSIAEIPCHAMNMLIHMLLCAYLPGLFQSSDLQPLDGTCVKVESRRSCGRALLFLAGRFRRAGGRLTLGGIFTLRGGRYCQ